MNILMNRRRGVGKKGDVYPKIVDFRDNILYTRTSSSDLSVFVYVNQNYCGIVIDLGAETQIYSLSFSCGIQTSTPRFLSYDSNNVNQTQYTYSPSPRTVNSLNASIRTIYLSVYKNSKEDSYIYDNTNDKYIFNGATFDWSKYGIE